jgi:small subunit ribosomal protein S20
MPHTESAKKRLRQSEKNRLRNRAAKRTLKLTFKKVQAAAQAGDLAKLKEECRLATKTVDQTAAKGIVHRNFASRKKHQLAVLLRKHEKQTAATK